MEKLVIEFSIPIIAKGGIWTPDQFKKVFELGAHAAVIDTAITRPMEITKRFVEEMK
ncbi:hypothetical protein H0173_07805 [Bacillus sp. S/N-304-OC-R1]|nr:hypothetical protein [Bacillus sp. S/N-304-OC-R1]